MKSTLSKVVIFSLGAAAGSVVSWKLLKTKYEQIAQEEIESVREVYSKKQKELKKLEELYNSSIKLNSEKEKPVEDYKNQYRNIAENYKKGGSESMKNKPYVVTPEEFGELDEYETISLTYYSDGILTDERDEPIDNIDELVGVESLDRFGEYEDDSVFVRNDRLKCDFEILADNREYTEIVNNSLQDLLDEG